MKWCRSVSAIVLSAALALTAAPVHAADLGGAPRGTRTYEPPPLDAPEPVFNRWSGFYIGGALGYNFDTTTVGGDIGNYSFEKNGSSGSLLAGINWQAGRLVFGVEADVGLGQLGASVDTASGTLDRDIQAFGTFRGRVGVLLTPALLLYATGGAAWANMDVTLAGETSNFTAWGYTIGGGAELAISNHVALRLEYLYTDLGSPTVSQLGQSNTFDTEAHTIRAGVTFKF